VRVLRDEQPQKEKRFQIGFDGSLLPACEMQFVKWGVLKAAMVSTPQ